MDKHFFTFFMGQVCLVQTDVCVDLGLACLPFGSVSICAHVKGVGSDITLRSWYKSRTSMW